MSDDASSDGCDFEHWLVVIEPLPGIPEIPTSHERRSSTPTSRPSPRSLEGTTLYHHVLLSRTQMHSASERNGLNPDREKNQMHYASERTFKAHDLFDSVIIGYAVGDHNMTYQSSRSDVLRIYMLKCFRLRCVVVRDHNVMTKIMFELAYLRFSS